MKVDNNKIRNTLFDKMKTDFDESYVKHKMRSSSVAL